MGSLIQLAIAGILVASVLGGIYAAWHTFTGWIGKPYAEAQRVADQQVVNAAETAQKAAESDRDTARGNSAKCESALKVSESAAKEAQERAKANIAEARKSKAESEREREAARPYIAGLQADAAAKANKAQTCEEQLAKADRVLTEALKRGRIGQPSVPK